MVTNESHHSGLLEVEPPKQDPELEARCAELQARAEQAEAANAAWSERAGRLEEDQAALAAQLEAALEAAQLRTESSSGSCTTRSWSCGFKAR